MMKMNISWTALLGAFLLIPSADAQDQEQPTQQRDAAIDLEHKVPPKEMERIKAEAAKLKNKKQTQEPAPSTEQADMKETPEEEQGPQTPEERERSLQRRQTMHQGFYPGRDITQKPKDILTEGPIKKP